jgi:N-acetylglucosamine kinase-like BadF-type ATPase
MTKILIGADAGGTKTAVVVAEDDKIIGRADGSGGAVRPGRALVAATTITEAQPGPVASLSARSCGKRCGAKISRRRS